MCHQASAFRLTIIHSLADFRISNSVELPVSAAGVPPRQISAGLSKLLRVGEIYDGAWTPAGRAWQVPSLKTSTLVQSIRLYSPNRRRPYPSSSKSSPIPSWTQSPPSRTTRAPISPTSLSSFRPSLSVSASTPSSPRLSKLQRKIS